MLRSATLWLVVCLTLGGFTSAMAAQGSPPAQSPSSPDTCSGQLPGDATGDAVVNRDDVNFLINYICNAGPAPNPLTNGDANGDCVIDFTDVNYLMVYLVYGGPAPVECTCVEPDLGACPEDTCAGLHIGDIDGDGVQNIADGVYLAGFLYKGGPVPHPLGNADVDADCDIDFDDLICLLSYHYPEDPCMTMYNCTCVFPVIDRAQPCGNSLCGDANGDGYLNVGDAVYLINILFHSGPPPVPYVTYSGDASGDCGVNVGDAVFIASYIFKGGARPPDCWYWIFSCGQLR